MPHVYLAVGHGIRPDGSFDPGATADKWSEQTAGDIVCARAAARLRGAGFQVTDEAHADDPNFYGSTRKANQLGVDLTVALHHDWSGAPTGAFGFWYPGSDRGKRAADLILAAVKEAGFGSRDSWHKARGELYIVRKTTMPATLFELGRIGQYSKAELQRLGDAVASGVAAFFGVPLKVSNGESDSAGEDEDMAAAEDLKQLVEGMQRAQNEAGFDSGPVDGIVGPKTLGGYAAMARAAKRSGGVTLKRVARWTRKRFAKKGHKHTGKVTVR